MSPDRTAGGFPAVARGGWCTFVVADGLYGVELERVQEVLRPQPLTRVPLAPPALVGLLNLRGQIVPAVDLRVVFGFASPAGAPAHAADPGGGGQAPGMVVVRAAQGAVALVVDAVGDVRHAPESASAADLPGAAASTDPLFAFALALPERLLVVLDLDRVLERAFARGPRDGRVRSARPRGATGAGAQASRRALGGEP